MASFVSANLGSDSDSDDQDYDPTKDGSGEVVSEEDGSGDDEDGPGTKKKGQKAKKGSKRKQRANEEKLGKRPGGILFVEDDEALKAEEERKKEFELEKVEKKEEDEKKKLDDLWADFKKDVKPAPAAAKPKPVGSGLGSWSMASKNSKTTKKVSSAPPKKKPTDIFSSIFDNIGSDSKISAKEETKRVEVPRSIISSIFEEKKIIPENSTTSEADASSSSQEKASVTEDGNGDKVTITKVFDFAGESVEVKKEVSKDSKEAQKFLKETASSSNETMTSSSGDSSTGGKRPGGLNSIMGIISGKKPKLGTLDKSKMDWNSFVEQEGIKEELQTHNKGKEGYVEKQMFLERADLRRFEIEKAAREKTRKTLNR